MKIKLNISEEVFVPKFFPYLQDYSHRYEVHWGGRGSGKTKFLIQKLVLKGLVEKRNILLMRKETNKIKDSVWKELVEVLDEWNLLSYFHLNRSEYRATCLINGTEFHGLGLDDSEKFKGQANVSDVLLDEITAFTEDDFELIDGTVRSKQYKLPLQIFVSFNPISKANWVYKYFGFDTNTPPPRTLITHSTYLDNPFLDESYITRMEELKNRNYNRWKIEAVGEWVTLDRLVYTNWEIGTYDTSNTTLAVGMDFGFVNDPTAITISYIDEKNSTIYVDKEVRLEGKTNEEIANVLKSLSLSKSIIIADSAEEKSIEEIRRAGIRRIKSSVKGKDSVINGIKKLWEYKIVVNPNCTNVITELENYSWEKDKKTGEYLERPIDMFNHFLDALRYSMQVLKTSSMSMLSKSSLF